MRLKKVIHILHNPPKAERKKEPKKKETITIINQLFPGQDKQTNPPWRIVGSSR